jgi:hypothetical protein
VLSRSELIKQKAESTQLSGDSSYRYGICLWEHPNRFSQACLRRHLSEIMDRIAKETLNKVSLSTGRWSKLPPDEIDKQTTKDSGDDEWF